MASIENRHGAWRVSIRKKDVNISRTFSNENDAKLWAAYKEDLIDNINAFQPPLEELITLNDAIQMKMDDAIKHEMISNSISRINALREQFSEFLDIQIHLITYQDLLRKAEKFSKTEIRQGGSEKYGGTYKLPSKKTVINRFVVLSTVFSHVVANGIGIENPAMKLVNFLKSKLD